MDSNMTFAVWVPRDGLKTLYYVQILTKQQTLELTGFAGF